MTTKAKAHVWGVGMPAGLHLSHFGQLCEDAFGAPVYLVGSALKTKSPRDVDVRVEMGDQAFLDTIGRIADFGRPGTRWAALCMAFAALGSQMTGRSIDFQIQPEGIWFTYADEPRHRLRATGD
jgi:hypothetical protein